MLQCGLLLLFVSNLRLSNISVCNVKWKFRRDFFSSIRFVDSALRKRLGKRKMKWKRKTNTQFKANIGNRICTDDIEWMSGADLVFWGKKFKRIFRTKFDIRYNQKDIKWNRFEMVESSIDGWRWWCNHPNGKEPSIFFICWHRWLPVCTCFK